MTSFAVLRNSALAFAAALFVACSPSEKTPVEGDGVDQTSSEIRSITTEEALADFDQIVASFRSLYGAMERKEAKYGFKFDTLAKQYRARVAAAKKEAEFNGIFQEFLARFQDPHITLFAPLTADDSRGYSLPFVVMPVENTYVVYAVAPGINIAIGEELVSMDGVAPSTLVSGFLKYAGVANPLAAKHFAAYNLTFRPDYASTDLSVDQPVKLTLRRADGTTHDETLNWAQDPKLLPDPTVPVAPPRAGRSTPKTLTAASASAAATIKMELIRLGSQLPFFLTNEVQTALNLTPVTPSEAALAKFQLTADDAQAVSFYAARYTVFGKKVLLLRLADYAPADGELALNYLRALLDEQQSQVDGLVLDQTHNPGGSIGFATAVVSLFAKAPTFNGPVQRMHGDRDWIQNFAGLAAAYRDFTRNPADAFAALLEQRAQLVDDAYSANKSLSEFIPFYFDGPVLPKDDFTWSKPVLVLADELSVSCADIVPLLFKANGLGTVFGEQTMGGGGNVEEVATLNNTRAALAISRGVGTVHDPSGVYPEARFIEDNGVTPDVKYSHTLADFRAGYLAYVQAFNAELLKKIP